MRRWMDVIALKTETNIEAPQTILHFTLSFGQQEAAKLVAICSLPNEYSPASSWRPDDSAHLDIKSVIDSSAFYEAVCHHLGSYHLHLCVAP